MQARAPLAMGQMKLEAPPQYSGGKKPSVRRWLGEVQRWMRLMAYPEDQYVDIVATRLEGAALSWLEGVLQAVERHQWQPWADWAEFWEAMVRTFEPLTEQEVARQELKNLRRTGRVSGYVAKFRDIRYRIPTLTGDEAYFAFVDGLQPHIKDKVGLSHVEILLRL